MFTLPKPKAISPLGHSADVSLFLNVCGQTLALAQTGRTELKLADDVPVPPGPTRVEIITDGVSHFPDVTIVGRRPKSQWLEIAD